MSVVRTAWSRKEKFFSNHLVPNIRRSNCLITNGARFLIRANSPPKIFFPILDQRLVTWYIPKNFTLPLTTKFLNPVQTDTTLMANLSQHCWMLHVASVRSIVYRIQNRSFLRTFSYRFCVLVWTENISKTEILENADVPKTIIIWGDFHARSRFARSSLLFLRKNGGLLVV